MTYGIIARCPRSGRLGLGMASYSLAVGLYSTDTARANTGASITMGAPNPGNNALAIRLLAQGFSSAHVLAELIGNDPNSDYRQIAIVDREGKAVAHTGAKTRPWCGHRIGEGFVAFGDMLAGEDVVDAIVRSYAADPAAKLEERLVTALEAGRDAGGEVGSTGRLPERSAVLVVHGMFDYSDWDLRVDKHDKAVDEMRRCHEEFKLFDAYYTERSRNPREAIPQREFAGMLDANRTRKNP
ncbi:MAG TPA: DUF1028 domain-containing protein [Alphaproteobacteria bacterium]